MNCEYQLPFGETFEETLRWQLMMRARQENEQKVQMYGDVVCYETLECESGLLCLDWREICDGIQNCLEGKDEENCDRLEMNQCDEEEEYRCTNGMCIPEEFFLDGDLDCFDWSDEMSFRNSNGCPWESVSTECDDHLGEVNQCSCGDGQFIDDRLNFQKSAAGVTCSSGRDQYFFCETHLTETRWTMANGRYHRGRGYQASTVANRSDEEQCEYLLRCALSAGGEIDCPCKNVSSCGAKLVNGCRLSLIPYPRRPVVTPYVFSFFNRTRDWQNRLPDWMLINGTVRCRSSLVNVSKWIPFDINLNVRQMIEEHFCRSSLSMNFSSDQPCQHSNQSTDRCDEWNRCFSRTRINDGWKNCLNGRDEGEEREMEIEKSCARVRPHRFRCSAERPICLSVRAMGNLFDQCRNGRDELWMGVGRTLSSMNCNQRRQDECSLVRQYIEQSGKSSNRNEGNPKIKRDVDEDNVFMEGGYVIMSGTVQTQRTSTPL